MIRMPVTRSNARKANAQAGQSMVEYLIILPSLLLLVLGAVQFGLLYQIKSQVNYATFAAARQGSLKGGSATAMKDAFAAGMTPLFTPAADFGSMARGRAVGAVEAFNPFVTKVERISPPESVKDDFGEEDPSDTSSKIVPNDNLQYRGTGEGGNSKINIQDANILKIRVTYCAKLVVPVANVVIYSLLNGIQGVKTVGGQFFAKTDQVATTTNFCTDIKDKYSGAIQKVEEVGDIAGADLSFIQSALNTVSSTLSGTPIPVLNWTLGGYRIPVTSEAVVRMQTPMKFKK